MKLASKIALVTGAVMALLVGTQAVSQDGNRSPGDFRPRKLMSPRRPIVDAPLLAAASVTDEVRDKELVLGVVVNGQPRAYPINMLTGPSREIINDLLGERAIAATW